MSGSENWQEIRDRRMGEPGAVEAYEHARLAFELGRQVRGLREERSWSQRQLAEAARMTQSAVARLEAGGTTPTLPVLERIAHALRVELVVKLVGQGAAA